MNPGLLRLSGELYAQILERRRPAGSFLSAHFRAHPELGARDRGVIGDLVHTALRHRRLLESVNPPGALMAAALKPLPDHADPAVRCSLPDFLWQALENRWGLDEAERLAAALNRPAPVDLRVNTLKGDVKSISERLLTEKIDTETVPYAPDALRLAGRSAINQGGVYRSGGVEIQDAGSQILSHLLGPQPGETVVDLCAGAGGKTLHVAALMENRGKVHAFDVGAGRLKPIQGRLKRAGVKIVRAKAIRNTADKVVSALTGKADRVLVDAPCSGTGTLRRHPEIKWFLTPEAVEKRVQQQMALLAAGAALVKPRGRLLYATCSVLEVENREVANRFLEDNPRFHAVPASYVLKEAGIDLPDLTDPYLDLLPHRHETDGFFGALFQRKK